MLGKVPPGRFALINDMAGEDAGPTVTGTVLVY